MSRLPKMIVHHNTMGPVEVLISFSTKDESGNLKNIALVKSKVKPKYDYRDNFVEFTNRYGSTMSFLDYKKPDRYYILWGISNNHIKSGWVELTTPSGRLVRGNKPYKMFNEFCNASIKLNFYQT